MRHRAHRIDEEIPERVATAEPVRAHEAALLQLQRTAGNRAVAGLLQGRVVHTLAEPGAGTFDDIQAMRPGSNFVTGATSMPDGSYRAPQFEMGTAFTSPGAWASTPTWKQKHDEGDSECVYLPPGRYRTAKEENGKPVFLKVSEEISERIRAGEQEHADDIKHARDISLKEAEAVLDKHVIGTTFPAAATKQEAEQRVLDRITANLTHPGLGNDQSKWGEIYRMLYSKTEERDRKGWHKFSQAYREEANGEVTYTVVDVRTKIGETPSAKLIAY